MNDLHDIKLIKEIAKLEGKKIDNKEARAIYTKVANAYIDTLLSEGAKNETKSSKQ